MKVQITIDGIKFDMPAAFEIPRSYYVTNNSGWRTPVHQCGLCSLKHTSKGECSYVCERLTKELERRQSNELG